MSVSRNFRVNLNLSNFFSDHRHTVRLFVNDDMETIEDLKRKIRDIFGLRDFHLVCQNEYLPPSEDVRILQKDELLWAMPDKSEKCIEGKLVLATETISMKPSKATKRSISLPEECVEEESSRPKKKKKKHSKEKEVLNIKKLLPVLHSHINSYNERNGNTSKIDREIESDDEKDVVCKGNLQNYKKKVPLPTITEEYLKNKKVNIVKINYVLGSPKMDKKDNECMNKEPVIEKSTSGNIFTSNETLHSNKVPEVIVGNMEYDFQEKYAQSDAAQRLPEKLVTTQEFQKLAPSIRRRRFFFTPPTSSEKIPKIEHQECIDKLSHSNMGSTTHIPQVEQPVLIDKSMKNACDQNKINPEVDKSKINKVILQIDDNSTTISPILPKSGLTVLEESKLNITNNDWETFSSEISVDKSSSQLSGFHKLNTSAKSKSKELSGIGHLLGDLRSSDSGSYETIADSSVEFISTKRRRHRKRASKKASSNVDESVIMIEPSPLKPINAKANPTIHLKFVEDEQSDHVVAVDVKKRDDEIKSQPVSDIEMSTVDDDVENFEIRDDKIKEYPVMGDLLPKCGDVVIFKKLKMTDDYCPTVSSWITGRVQAFDPQTRITTLDVVVGLDQCEEPRGKLSIDTDDNQRQHSTVREILWNDVIEPRLLYP